MLVLIRETLAGKVVRLQHTEYSEFQGEFQLELMPNFEVDIREVGEDHLRRLLLKKTPIAKAVTLEDRAKVCLLPVIVTSSSESKQDKNGKAYRASRITDAAGTVAQVSVWANLTDDDSVWKKNAVIHIMAAAVNKQEKRFDVRNFSQVTLAPPLHGVKLPQRVTSAKW